MLRHAPARFLSVLALLAAGGCANPGPPRAPSLHLPEPARGLEAKRVGDRVLFSWTTSAHTTDGEDVKGPIDAVFCLDGPAAHPVCRPVERVRVAVGPSQAALALTPDELRPPARLLAYRVDLENAKGRSAGLSAACFAASGPAPPPVGPLTVTARPEGALLTWQKTRSAATMELRRTSAGSEAPPKSSSRRPPAFEKPAAEVLLRPEAGPETPNGDTGGLLDRAPRDPKMDGVPVVYVARRTEQITLEGHRLELLGEPSAPVSFTFRDTFPPAAPAGLQAVPTRHPPAIDLAWEAGPDPGLAGYNLYRACAFACTAGGDFVRLNQAPLPAPAYRDLTAVPGTGYRYRVTAVDAHGNESAPGTEVRERIPQP